jgi:hypothetical protein
MPHQPPLQRYQGQTVEMYPVGFRELANERHDREVGDLSEYVAKVLANDQQ